MTGTSHRRGIVAALTLTLAAVPCAAQTIVFVDTDANGGDNGTSWSDAYEDLSVALAAAQSSDQLWIAEGTYLPTAESQPGDPRSVTFDVPDSVELYGGFDGTETLLSQRDPDAHSTILSGDIGVDGSTADNAYHVVSATGVGSGTLLDGLTIRDGHADGVATADQRGAGLSLSAADIVLRDCRLLDNTATILTGAALDSEAEGSPLMEDCTVSGNSSGLRIVDGTFLLDGTVFSGQSGSSVYVDGGDATITDCDFTLNAGASVRAFALSTGTVSDCDFTDNTESPISFQNAGVWLIEDCLFDSNDNDDVGGAADVRNGAHGTTFDRCRFLDNTSDSVGGAIFVQAVTIEVYSSLFENNSADIRGGAIAIALESMSGVTGSRIMSCEFLGNSSAQGGAVAAYGGQAGFFVEGSSPVITNSAFSGNVATDDGGAFFSDGDSDPLLLNCSMSGNTAGDQGGGIYGTETGFIPQPESPNIGIANCVLWGNTDSGPTDQSAQMLVDPGVLISVRSCVQGWDGTITGSGNHGLDPLFVDADGDDDIAGNADDDLSLSAGSPCIDAGSTGLAGADTPDMDCDGDVLEPLALDLARVGRFADDPATVDTGTGGAPFVDMGAYEFSAWENLGAALEGATGEPCLVGDGTLESGGDFNHTLTNARPNTTATLFLGFSELSAPFKGGTLVPFPHVVIAGLPTGPTGGFFVPIVFPAGVPPGVQFWIQYWVVDTDGVFGLAASNAVVATSP